MKKIFTLLLVFLFSFTFLFNFVYAANEYTFDIDYEGQIVVNQEKDATVELIGVDGPTYSNVRIKVDIEGPATPKIYAFDSQGTKIDIAETGYWGPADGFSVTGTFTNTTPIKATFSEAGTYVIKLSLINVQNANAVIATRDITIDVSATAETDEDKDNLTEEENNTVNEIPKTGRSVEEYAGIGIVCVAIVLIGIVAYRRKL